MTTLDHSEIDAALAGTAWERTGEEISRTIDCETFPKALKFVNSVGELAEAANHHPDIDIRWKNVKLLLTTHSDGGLTRKDLDLALQIDQISI